jgi:hypothetical protein
MNRVAFRTQEALEMGGRNGEPTREVTNSYFRGTSWWLDSG